MNIKPLIFMIVCLFSCAAYAEDAPKDASKDTPKDPPDGLSGFLLSNVTIQKSTEQALRNRPSPFRSNLVTDTGTRLQNFLSLQIKNGSWALMASYADNRTLGGGNAYSLTNPMTFGVNTVETTGTSRNSVDYKSGLHELAATYKKNGTMVMVGKIDTSNWYLADSIFGGDLGNGNDYGNSATRVVAPPFPSVALVVKQEFVNGLSITGIVGDAFGDRETIYAARNLAKGDLAYVLELNFQDKKQHYQLTYNHIDSFRFYDKDAVWPGPGQKAPQVDAVMASASYRFNENWAGFGRFSYSAGDGQMEDINYLAGVRFDLGKFYALASQSATRVATGNTPYRRGARGDYTLVSELTFNYKVYRLVTLSISYDMYNSSGNSLLAKDGGWNGSKQNHILGMRITSFIPFSF